MISCLCELCFLLKTREVVGGCGPPEDAARFLSGGLRLNRVRFFTPYGARQEAAAELLDLRLPPQVPGPRAGLGCGSHPTSWVRGKPPWLPAQAPLFQKEFNFFAFLFSHIKSLLRIFKLPAGVCHKPKQPSNITHLGHLLPCKYCSLYCVHSFLRRIPYIAAFTSPSDAPQRC